ncbi:hypothetical protein [Verrucomicrobium spinosum]|uniref:hypothetical protein n=1 Tax=Verrucomicrobium spinosum TaxID=2736 RepID=UPI000B0C87D0|nr:hypothetical protein [Verrucomicrobium spinosum]
MKFKPSAIVMVTGTAIIIIADRGWSTASVVVTAITTATSGTADITGCTNAGGIARREHSVPALRRNLILAPTSSY